MGRATVVFEQLTEHLRLTKEGLWLSNGQEITHAATLRAFFKFLRQSADGTWSIRIGNEEKPVTLDDTPRFVQRITGSAAEGYRIHLLDDQSDHSEPLKPETLSYTPGRLVCLTSAGWEARFLRTPYYEVLKHLQRDFRGHFLEITGTQVRLDRT